MLLTLVSVGVNAQDWIYTVRPGDNLWDISERYLIDMVYWRRLQAYNNVTDPEHIPPGTRLRVPIEWLATQPIPAKALAIEGEVMFSRGASRATLKPLEVGAPLRAGDRVSTGPDSNATLEFADGSRLQLQADSEVTLDTLSGYQGTGMVDTRMRLQRGRLENQVEPAQGPGSRYRITTPVAISAVRGTEYRIDADAAEQLSRAEVLTGEVTLTARNRTTVLRPGFGALVESGRPPTRPIPLLPPPDPEQLPPVIERVPMPFRLPPLEGAVAYRLQIAATEEFVPLLFSKTSTTDTFRGPDLPDGDYVLRVRGIDERGLEGRDTIHRFTLNARPEPPALVSPEFEGTVVEAQPEFEWGRLSGAQSYSFQLADNAEFNVPLVERNDLSGTNLSVENPLAPGVYYWRVAVRDETGMGPFSDPQPFRRPQPSPNLEEAEVKKDTITFRWTEGLPGERYRFQFTKDWRFDTIQLETEVDKPQVTLRRPESGFYYLRIQLIESDGFEGPWGPIQQVDIPPESYWPLIIPLLPFLL